VLQYEVQFSEGHTCGGAYIKLLPADPAFQPTQLTPNTSYTIMFGPDRCGPHSRVRSGRSDARVHLLLALLTRWYCPAACSCRSHSLTAPYMLQLQTRSWAPLLHAWYPQEWHCLLVCASPPPPLLPPL
jgi:hypothetical protein